MKGDNFVIGVSSVDSSTINLGKESGQSQTLHVDTLVLGLFLLGFCFFVFIGFLLSSLTVLPTHHGAL